MPAVPPLVDPMAVVVVDAFCVAWAASLPVSVRSGPMPIDAIVVMFEIAIATWAESASVPLPADAPPFALVVIASMPLAVMVRFFAPVSAAPSARPALVVSLTTLRPREAPTPLVVPSPASLASPIAEFLAFEVAVRVTSPLTVVDSGWTRARVLLDTTLTAIDPATLSPLVPPAPEVEWAAKLEAPGPRASTVTPPPAVRFVLPAR